MFLSKIAQISLLTLSTLVIGSTASKAETQSLVTGDSPEEVQQNAFDKGMDYPVGPLKCSQRCRQWWGKD